MSFVEEVYKRELKRTLKDVITYVNQHMTRPERARFLLLLSKDMTIVPKDLVKVTFDWRSDA